MSRRRDDGAPSSPLPAAFVARLRSWWDEDEAEALAAALDGSPEAGLRIQHDRIDAAQVATLYSDGGLAARLLTALLADGAHPDAATLAHELIEEARKP